MCPWRVNRCVPGGSSGPPSSALPLPLLPTRRSLRFQLLPRTVHVPVTAVCRHQRQSFSSGEHFTGWVGYKTANISPAWSPSKVLSVCGSLDSEDSLLFWRSVPPPSTDNHRRPSSSLSTSSTMVSRPVIYTHTRLWKIELSSSSSYFCSLQSRGSMLQTPKGPSPLTITEDTPASRLMAQGTRETLWWFCLHSHPMNFSM